MKHSEKDGEQQKADTVRKANEVDWLMRPGVTLVATMQDTKGSYFIAIGVQVLGVDYKIPTKIDDVSVRVMYYKKVTFSEGATDISHALISGVFGNA